MQLKLTIKPSSDIPGYPVVVEMWDKVKYGKQKRAFHSEFSEEERRLARKYYNLFYGWYLRTGAPDEHTFPGNLESGIKKLNFVKRLINFFGTL